MEATGVELSSELVREAEPSREPLGPPLDRSQDPVSGSPLNRSEDPVSGPPLDLSQDPVSGPPLNRSEDPVSGPPLDLSQDPVSRPPLDRSEDPVSGPPLDRSEDPVSGPPLDLKWSLGLKELQGDVDVPGVVGCKVRVEGCGLWRAAARFPRRRQTLRDGDDADGVRQFLRDWRGKNTNTVYLY
uniref:Uncharacterized protein n=1 Tax=Dicentrarchus labrax TaxID=13489 RepID=A0A8C4F7A2_DICLA